MSPQRVSSATTSPTMPAEGRHRHEYWFPAKRYGWGWSLPSTWQGWFVLLAYLAVVSGLVYFVPPPSVLFYGLLLGATVLFGCVCWLKGEPPRWRWGRE